MLKQMTRFALATVFATAIAGYGVAHAQDEDDDAFGGDAGGDMGGDSGGGDMGGGDNGGGDNDNGGGGDMGGGAGGPTMGISTAFPTGGDGGAANILYGMGGENWLDLRLGVNFSKGVEDPITMTGGDSVFGVDLGLGYRMYKPVKGKIRPYLEPAVFFGIDDFSAAGDTMFLALAALMGVDYALMDQFTLGVGVGAGLSFTQKFKAIDFGLFTTSINATFWW
jgi:hypothetical protein